MKLFIKALKKSEALSSIAIRLVYITGKSPVPIHPKHLVKKNTLWFKKFLKKDDVLLDIGCGIGADAIKSAQLCKTVIGLDIDRKSIKTASLLALKEGQKNARFLFHNADNKLPFKDRTFDKVVASDVLEHLKKRDFALSEIKRVLKTKGILFLVVDNPDTSWKKRLKERGLFYYADPQHYYEYPRLEIEKELKKKGFNIISVSTITYDTPLKGLIDLTGGISLSLYKRLGAWKRNMLEKYPEETTGYKIIAQKDL